MRENICFYFMQTHVLFIFSLVLLCFNTTAATSLGHKLVVAAGGATNTCINNEREALLRIKARLLHPNDPLSTWRREEEDDCCKWRGVTCDNQTGHVTMLDLMCSYYTGVGGEVSFSLLNLTYLNHLDLSDCSFHGTIPPFIGSMTQLTFLNLASNHFVGTIPMSIGSLKNLTTIDLSENNFSGIIPRSIGSLTKLTSLSLSNNSLHGTIPREFGNLTNLLTLDLRYLDSCTIENLDWLSSLSSLSKLDMDGTSLAKVNNWVNVIIGLQNLYWLTLGRCDLSKVMHPYSSVVNSSSSIGVLYLDNNNLNSSSYRWLCPLVGKKLTSFDVSGNSFDGNLSDFLNNLSRCTSLQQQQQQQQTQSRRGGGCTSLQQQQQHTRSRRVGGCTSLNRLFTLDASGNQLTGSLSDEIKNFSSLDTLNLAYNHLNGTISDKLWQLPTLHRLNLSSNSLRGVISENIGKSNLFKVDLSHNSLEGALFNADLSELSMSVQYIDFSSNKLGPCFPKWIQKMKKLRHLDLSNNSISETFPTENWNQWLPSQLRYLDLSLNNISGTLPESLSNPKLEFVDLSSNSFYGPIPTFPAQISFLDLSDNSLTGKLPDSLKNLTYLKVLNLGHNMLSGYIPPCVGCFGQLEKLSLYSNSFSGELPLFLKNCTKLSLLNLGANKLYGNIPVWIGKDLSRLYALSLKSNNFSGAIPSQICQLASLQILDLSFNNLQGTIPSCVHNLTSMVQKGLFTEHNLHRYNNRLDIQARYYSVDYSYDHLLIQWQGKVNEFGRNLRLMKTIDLSTNSLTGPIPYEITNLQGLVVLNLSHNALLGEIPKNIGQMQQLQTLDLSKNNFSGGLPSSMSQLNFLNYLDVSDNNLSGRIPSGTQLQTFELSRFIGNARLCGPPLTKYCPGDKELEVTPVVGESKSNGETIDELKRWFYIGGAAGFVTAFWIVFGTLLLNRRARHAFFECQDSLKDWVYVKVAVFMAKWRRVACA
ncbi:Leucine-rich repeat-containing protein [Artemisia annua]|uniref:Leucine-rich repeat-containing protein n=1 Tax=Artemisia annua TaxID=35608 RepID=A0A2U1Q2N0_ARTAN|nr:Leucine-rich repeat-containing protein [Artemisia annua]